VYEWVRNTYSESSAKSDNLALRDEEKLCDRTYKMRFTDLPLDKLWISVGEEYPAIHRKAINILLQFSTSYICEQAFCCIPRSKAKI
jgi:hypothetical protein